ncbi:methyltransferase domain-containing protein [Streptomyces sp. NPDC002623]
MKLAGSSLPNTRGRRSWLCQAARSKADATNVEFLKGTFEAIPLPANTIDVVISKCVINLSTGKPAVFAEAYRMLKTGRPDRRVDVVADDSPTQHAERGDHVGCVTGALSYAEYSAGLEASGFTDVEIIATHAIAEACAPRPSDCAARHPDGHGSRHMLRSERLLHQHETSDAPGRDARALGGQHQLSTRTMISDN